MKNLTFTTFIDRVDDLILKNMENEQFSVEELGRLLFLSPSQTYKKIKNKTGQNPSEYIRNKRLEKSHQLILNTKLSISDIAWNVGFSRPSYFSRSFHDYFGYNPSSLRQDGKNHFC